MKQRSSQVMDNLIIGIDLDNTLICYDYVLLRLAKEKGCFTEKESMDIISKTVIRDRVRQTKAGDIEWQKMQALIYTELMSEARLFPGVEVFFNLVRDNNIQIYLVSHKTEYARLDKSRTSLRETALDWMQGKGFFSFEGFKLSLKQVYFESTREDKINRMKKLGCTHFIDDLVELFQEESFPAHIKKILFDPNKQEINRKNELGNLIVMHSWREIADYYFSKS